MSPARPATTAACPCGSGVSFGDCCGPALDGTPPPTPERLMRSRYTAFAIGDAGYLSDTWHPGTRPAAVEIEPGLRWIGLEILGTDGGGEGERRGRVEFAAHWRSAGERGTLHEHSRFVRQSDRWWYLDGDVR